MNKADIIGRWEIVQWVQQYDDGRLVYPMGTELRGFIDYGASSVLVIIEKAHRAHFFSGGQWNASDTEKAAAYNSYMTYAGDYEVRDNVITHHIKYSLFPDWEGAHQRRTAELNGDRLTLSARVEEGTAQARTIRLEWRRASKGT
jgi:hypothetical protein